MGRTVVVAPWGDPAGWVWTSYYVDGGEEVRAFTSLAALSRRYEYSDVVIVVADTLALPEFSICEYPEVVEAAKRYAERYLCGLKSEILVAPGVIRQARREFRGSVTDYYYVLLGRLLELLLGGNGGPFESVVLDLTHGINYMPVLTLKAVEEAASIASLANALRGGADSVRLLVFNSDPVIPQGELRGRLGRDPGDPCRPRDSEAEPLKARLNVVLKRRYTVLDLISNLESLDLTATPKAVGPLSQECKIGDEDENELRKAIEEARRILKMLRHGLVPELLYYTSRRGAELEEALEAAIGRARKLWNEGVAVDLEGGLRVKRCRGFGEGYRVLLYAYHITRQLVETSGREAEPGLDAARKLVKALERAAVIRTIQHREISKLKWAARKDMITGEWKKLALVYGGNVKECRDAGVFRRDLLAHGGWHTDVVEVRKATREAGSEAIVYRIDESYKCRGKGLWETIDEL